MYEASAVMPMIVFSGTNAYQSNKQYKCHSHWKITTASWNQRRMGSIRLHAAAVESASSETTLYQATANWILLGMMKHPLCQVKDFGASLTTRSRCPQFSIAILQWGNVTKLTYVKALKVQHHSQRVSLCWGTGCATPLTNWGSWM